MTDDFRRGLEELSLEVSERHRRQPGLPVPLIARAARGRRRRHESLMAAGSAAALVLVAVTGSALLDRGAPAPAPPAQTSSPTPSVEPSRTPTASEPARALAPKGHASEPDAWVITDDTWATVGAGWALTLFSTVSIIPGEDYGTFDPAGTQALFLVAPDGTTYRLSALPADGEGEVMWWDATQRKAWMYFKGLGESWWYTEVDLRDGSLREFRLGPNSRDAAPVLQRPDGRVLWADTDPHFPTGVHGLYWQGTDGTITPLAGDEIEGDVWLDPVARDIVEFLARSVDGYDLTSIDLTNDSIASTPLGAAPEGSSECGLTNVLATSALVTCSGAEPFGWRTYDVAGRTFAEAADVEPSDELIQGMLMCGALEVPWSAGGRELDAPLAAQGWSDAWVLPATPGAALSVPKKFGGC